MLTRGESREVLHQSCRSGMIVLMLLVLCTGAALGEQSQRSAESWTESNRSIRDVWTTPFEPDLVEGAQRLMCDGSPVLQAERLSGRAAPARLQAVVLMCDFADSLLYGRYYELEGDYPPPAQSDFYYLSHDSTFFHHQMTDVRAYFDAVSGGRFEFDFEVVPTVANLPHPMAWYGNHPDEGEQKVLLARDAIAMLDDTVDFSLYDTVVLIHAGAGEETDILGDSPEQIYSSYLSPETFVEAHEDEIIPDPWLPTGDVYAGGEAVTIGHVLILPENEFQDSVGGVGGYYGSLGVYCFEVGLRLGMLSLSDFTPAGYPDSQGIGEFGLMGYGLFVGAGFIPAHPCAFNKMLMGWLDPYPVDPDDDETYSLYPAGFTAADSMLARVEISPSEYWLLEYRQQDPDGNGIFSFPGDLNGNNIPDYYDADSDSLDGTPTSWFDPETDDREWLYAAEFDFFMSENSARTDDAKGAGSGLYIWHVDESVVEAAFLADRNIFNADPARKAVDLEEADGIQDLDSRIPTPYVLGADYDSFRGEDSHVFGPDTSPSTETAGGVPTGIVIDMISRVVADSAYVDPARDVPVILYADTMTFRCRRQGSTAIGVPELVARVRLDDVDLRGGHLLAADLDGSGDGRLEIVATGDGGRVYTFSDDLTPHVPGIPYPYFFAVGKGPNGALQHWTGPAAVGDVDGDGLPEILLTAASGLFVFNAEDGSELSDGDGDPLSDGLVLPLEDCTQPPIVIPADQTPDDRDTAIVLETWDAGRQLRAWNWNTQTESIQGLAGLDLSPTSPLARWQGATYATVATGDEGASLVRIDDDARYPMPTTAGGMALLAGDDGLIIPAVDGGAMRLADPDATEVTLWPSWLAVRSPVAPGPTYVGDDVFIASGNDGYPRTGWPVQPRIPVKSAFSASAATPLVFVVEGRTHVIYASRDGRLYLYDETGRLAEGWPLAGPGQTAGTPVLADIDGEPGLELVAVGATSRLAGYDEDGEPVGDAVSSLAVWRLPGTETATVEWPMWGGSAMRSANVSTSSGGPVGTALLVADSHICYPAPLVQGDLHVRVVANRDCLMRAYLYNLEGEEVRVAGPVHASGGPFEIVMDVDIAVSGVYMCRLVAESDGIREVSIRPVTIAR
jgi:M6 family metalloprotease-like protein